MRMHEFQSSIASTFTNQGFDVLKEDFDYSVISAVLLGLVGAAYVVRRLSQRKALNAAWK